MIARTPAKPTRASTQLDPEVEKWLDAHAIATGKSDINLVVTEGDAEIFVPVSKAILAVNSGLLRGLPDSDDVPIIGDHDARTVVQYASLCKPRKINGSSAEALEDRFDTLRMQYTSQMKIQDASTKFLALSHHLLSYYPGAPKPAKDTPKK